MFYDVLLITFLYLCKPVFHYLYFTTKVYQYFINYKFYLVCLTVYLKKLQIFSRVYTYTYSINYVPLPMFTCFLFTASLTFTSLSVFHHGVSCPTAQNSPTDIRTDSVLTPLSGRTGVHLGCTLVNVWWGNVQK